MEIVCKENVHNDRFLVNVVGCIQSSINFDFRPGKKLKPSKVKRDTRNLRKRAVQAKQPQDTARARAATDLKGNKRGRTASKSEIYMKGKIVPTFLKLERCKAPKIYILMYEYLNAFSNVSC